ncbi:MAG: dihydropteroate synthase [Planctomycetaceae bacterium]|nr:dihydropteroate synthase [Planctomycetaceae bacterium]
MSRPRQVTFEWQIRGGKLRLGERTLVMGIVNITPDSFSDGGKFLAATAAVEHALQLENEGADLLDLGGESTRPGAEPVSELEELRRVIPVVERLAGQVRIPLSIDTTKARVAREALAAGAAIINDISGLRSDPEIADVCREFGAGVICMHMQGTPQTMQHAPTYQDVVAEIAEFFRERQKSLAASGLAAEQLVWDPGVGFGKTAQHNLDILGNIGVFRELGRPVLIGHSRKRFLQKVLGKPVDERMFGTLGVSLALAAQGVDIIRVHDAAAHRDALIAFQSVIEPSWQRRWE